LALKSTVPPAATVVLAGLIVRLLTGTTGVTGTTGTTGTTGAGTAGLLPDPPPQALIANTREQAKAGRIKRQINSMETS
jgi:hypothetical protein